MSPEPHAGSADVFVEQLTELLDAHVVRPRPAVDADPDAVPGAPAPAAALLAALSAPATWGEPPADLRDTVLARVLGRDVAAPVAGPGKAGDAEPEDDEEPIAATAAPVKPEAGTATSTPEAEPAAATPEAAAEAEGFAADVGIVPGATAKPAGDGDAVVRELRPRWRRLAWAVPVAAAAAAVFTVAVLGVQQALETDEPVGVTYSAAGTQLAPDATAKVTVAKAAAGFSVVIDVQNLPAAAPGSYYIAWLRGPDGVVPLGSFHARQIAKPITLWSGVDPTRYQTFSVTLQREGAPPTPSGVTVLRGTLSK